MKNEKHRKKRKKTEEEIVVETMEEMLYSRNMKKWGFDLNPFVSITAGVLILILSIYAFVSTAELFGLRPAHEVFDDWTGFVVDYFDWVFIMVANFLIILSFYLAFSKLGRVRIGGVRQRPEFSNFAWYSMLISAGMGIGLMFWAVGEPLTHSRVMPPVFTGEGVNIGAMATTFLHWGLHPWSIYAVLALALSYFAYNKKLPLSLRSLFYPLFKEKVFGRLGDVIDLLAVLATLFGLATSLGLGVQQINSGLEHLVGLPFSVTIQVVLIVLITAVATISIISGIDKGVKFLSKMNMRIAAVFMILILLLGPSLFILRLYTSSFGAFLGGFAPAAFFLALDDVAAREWQGGWTIFYWAWWISWSPFVGMFIARVSKGRTIRELIVAVLVVPSMLSFFWLSVFGGTAFSVDAAMGGGLFDLAQENIAGAMFEMIANLDIAFLRGAFVIILSTIATVLVIFFFITSSDSGSIVVNAITSGGKTDTKARQRVFWAAMEGLIAAVLLVIGGEQALQALQNAVILTGLPFAIILLVMSVLLVFSLKSTHRTQQYKRDVRLVKKVLEDEDVEIEIN